MWVDIAGNPAATAAFYPNLFGWQITHNLCYLNNHPVAGIRPSHTTAWLPALPVDDLRQAHTRITRAGGHITRDGLVKDPLGATFRLVDSTTDTRDEPGAPVWVEHRSHDRTKARQFYRDVFGYLYQHAGPAGYVTFQAGTGGLALGGLAVGGRAGWYTYFSVADTDDAVATVKALGGRVRSQPEDTEFGRVSTVTDDQGAAFVLVSASVLLTQTDKPIVTICG